MTARDAGWLLLLLAGAALHGLAAWARGLPVTVFVGGRSVGRG
jgi:hypothetical protein